MRTAALIAFTSEVSITIIALEEINVLPLTDPGFFQVKRVGRILILYQKGL